MAIHLLICLNLNQLVLKLNIYNVYINIQQNVVQKLESDYHITKDKVIREVAKYAFMPVTDVTDESHPEAVKIYDMKSRHKIKALELIITTLQYDKEPENKVSEIRVSIRKIDKNTPINGNND
jgi:hypothetical protein